MRSDEINARLEKIKEASEKGDGAERALLINKLYFYFITDIAQADTDVTELAQHVLRAEDIELQD